MPFSFAGAAAGASGALRQQQQDSADLETALAAAESRRQAIAVQQAQVEQSRQEMALRQRQFEASQQPKPAEPFTLGPGQKRFGPNGQEIATGVLVSPAAAQAQGFTLSPGQTRYGADGKQIAQSAPRPTATAAGAKVGTLAGPKYSAAQQAELEAMLTVSDVGKKTLELGDRIGWKGVGGMHLGSIDQFAAKNLGMGTPDEQTLRNYIGNIKGTVARLRGGTSFTPNEQQMLETYTPTIDDSPQMIKSKIATLNELVALKGKNMQRVASGDTGAGSAETGGGAEQWVRDPATGKLRKQ